MRIVWKEWRGAVAEPLDRLDLKPCPLDSGCRVARQVTPSRNPRPEVRIGDLPRSVHGAPYQACEAPQCGQETVVETDAANTKPQAQV